MPVNKTMSGASATINPSMNLMRRSHSKNALFNEGVIEVNILKSPARKTCVRAPSEMGVQGGVSDEVKAILLAQQTREVTIYDALLKKTLGPFNINQSHTIEYLKTRIQSRQGQERLRIIPAHIQLLSFKGTECNDLDKVWTVMGQGWYIGEAVLVLEPRVNELVSFFLASVSNLVGPEPSPKADRQQLQLSPTTSCADASFAQPVSHMLLEEDNEQDNEQDNEEDMLFPMDVEHEAITRTPSTPSSPRSVSSPGAPHSPVVCMIASYGSGTKKQRTNVLRVDVAGSPDTTSAMPTPVSDNSFDNSEALPGTAGAAACSFDGMSYIGQMMQLHSPMPACDPCVPSAYAAMPRTLNANLLRKLDKGNYSSQSHIIFRDGGSCLLQEQLTSDKLKEMELLVLEVQSGLRHGHVPEELSTSGRDSTASHQSLVDSGADWELERASWWQQHLMTQQAKADGQIVTDFDYGELVQNCCGGTYMMRNSHAAHSAVFKPIDEEPFAPSNPKGYVGLMDVESEMKAGVVVGGGAARECAAFLLDHQGLGAVPCTAMLRIVHTTLLAGNEAEVQIKVGSLQRFEKHDCTAEDVGTARFNLTQAHAIGVLDVRTFNMDRNSDNVLVKMASTSSSSVQLVPIDHGYILPSYKHLEEVHVCWLYWPQSKEAYSEDMLAYIAELDAECDMQLLRSTLALPEESLLTLFIGTTLIKAGALHGLTLHETGMLMVRERSDHPSAIEQVVAEASFLAETQGSFLAETQGYAADVMCQDFYDVVKMHLQELIGQLVLAHQMD